MQTKQVQLALSLKETARDGIFSGYASVFDIVDYQNESIAPGAFVKSLKKWRRDGQTPPMLWMHDPEQPIGLWLSIREDKKGLYAEGKLALRTTRGAEAYELLKMGALTGLSIGFRTVSSRVDATRKARILTEIDLFEISLVTFPANESARVRDVKTEDDMTRAIVSRLHKAARLLSAKDKP